MIASIKSKTSPPCNRQQNRRRWWDRYRWAPQGIEVDLVVTSQFEMLELVSSGQDVEGDVQHVIGLMVRQVTLEEMEPAVDVVNQSALAGY